MELMTGFVLVCIAVALVALGGAALIPTTFARLTAVGAVLALVHWGFWAVVIYRGPDNPDLGEFGWTVFMGIVSAVFFAAWILGLAVGHALRRSRSAGTGRRATTGA
jgi:uncharacterized membrane protein